MSWRTIFFYGIFLIFLAIALLGLLPEYLFPMFRKTPVEMGVIKYEALWLVLQIVLYILFFVLAFNMVARRASGDFWGYVSLLCVLIIHGAFFYGAFKLSLWKALPDARQVELDDTQKLRDFITEDLADRGLHLPKSAEILNAGSKLFYHRGYFLIIEDKALKKANYQIEGADRLINTFANNIDEIRSRKKRICAALTALNALRDNNIGERICNIELPDNLLINGAKPALIPRAGAFLRNREILRDRSPVIVIHSDANLVLISTQL